MCGELLDAALKKSTKCVENCLIPVIAFAQSPLKKVSPNFFPMAPGAQVVARPIQVGYLVGYGLLLLLNASYSTAMPVSSDEL